MSGFQSFKRLESPRYLATGLRSLLPMIFELLPTNNHNKITKEDRNAIRRYLSDFDFVEISIHEIPKDRNRPHGFRYRLAWIQILEGGVHRRRVLFDNHHGKSDHYHLDGSEFSYEFGSIEQLLEDFEDAIKKLGGPL
jgi:hypothetical protein